MRLLLLLALLWQPCQATVTFLTPTSGDRYRGDTVSISWSVYPAGAETITSIQLVTNGNPVMDIATTVTGTSHTWQIPAVGVPASYCYIRLVGTSSGGSAVQEDSSGFYIRAKPSSLTFVTPSSGATFYRGQQLTTTWTTDGDIPKVNIDLYRSGTRVLSVAVSTPNTGTYTYTLADNIQIGSYFSLKITSDASINPVHDLTTGDSNSFTIAYAPATLKLNQPSGGDVYVGYTTPIAWTTTGSITKVSLYYRQSDVDYPIVTNVANTGSHNWDVQPGIVLAYSSLRVYAAEMNVVHGDVPAEVYDQSSSFYIKSEPAMLDVTGPTSSINRGQTVAVTWDTTPRPDSVTAVLIEFLKGGAEPADLTYSLTTNPGTFQWTVPTNMSLASYRIRITGTQYNPVGTSAAPQDMQSYGPTVYAQTFATAPSFTAPTSGTTLEYGSAVTLTWDCDPMAAVTTWQLTVKTSSSGTNVAYTHPTPIPNTGSFAWTVPSSLPAGYVYLTMTATAWNHNYGDSVAFTSSSVSIATAGTIKPTINSPLSNTQYKLVRGEPYDVRYTMVYPAGATAAAVQSFRVGLRKSSTDGEPLDLVILQDLPNNGSFRLTLPDSAQLGYAYLVLQAQASDAKYGLVEGSEGSFSIVAQDISIAISSPASSTTLQKGRSQLFTWTVTPAGTTPLPADVAITKYQATISRSSTVVAQFNDLLKREVNYTIPADAQSGYYYFAVTALEWHKRYGDVAPSVTGFSFDIAKQDATINVLQPASGSIIYLNGSLTVKWDTQPGLYAIPTVTLRFRGTSSNTIATAVPNTGSYTFLVDVAQPVGSSYQLIVESASLLPEFTDGSTSPIQDTSSYFEIAREPAGFQIEEPKLDEQWNKTTASAIEWTTTGEIGQVKIELFRYSDLVMTVADKLQNTGVYFWTVPVDIALSNEQPTQFKLVISAVPGTYSAKYVVSQSSRNIFIGPKTDNAYEPNLPQWNPICPDKLGCRQLVGDAYCACMRDCGRRCVPGYKYLFSGFDSIYNELRGFVLQPEFNEQLWTPDTNELKTDFYVPTGVIVQQEATLVVTSTTEEIKDYSDITHDEQISYSSSVGIAEKLTGSVDAEYVDLFNAVKQNDYSVYEWNYKNPTYKLTMQSSRPKLDPFFEASINQLPTTYDQAAYFKQIALYGYEYPYAAVLGQKVQTRTLVNRCYAKTVTENTMTASISASAESATGADNSTSTTDQNGSQTKVDKTAIECLRSKSSSTVIVKGGKIEVLECAVNKQTNNFECNGDWVLYQKTKYENPYRLQLYLNPVADLIPDATKRANWVRAVQEYVAKQEAAFASKWTPPTAPGSPPPCPCDKQVDDNTKNNAASPEEKESRKKAVGGYVALGVVAGLVGMAVPVLKKFAPMIKDRLGLGGPKNDLELQEPMA